MMSVTRVAVVPVVVLLRVGMVEAGDYRAIAVGLGAAKPFVEVGQIDARRQRIQDVGAVVDVEVAGAAGAIVLGIFKTRERDEMIVGGGGRLLSWFPPSSGWSGLAAGSRHPANDRSRRRNRSQRFRRGVMDGGGPWNFCQSGFTVTPGAGICEPLIT